MYRLFINGVDYMSYKIGVSIGYGQSVPVRKLAEKFGQGDLLSKRIYTR